MYVRNRIHIVISENLWNVRFLKWSVYLLSVSIRWTGHVLAATVLSVRTQLSGLRKFTEIYKNQEELKENSRLIQEAWHETA